MPTAAKMDGNDSDLDSLLDGALFEMRKQKRDTAKSSDQKPALDSLIREFQEISATGAPFNEDAETAAKIDAALEKLLGAAEESQTLSADDNGSVDELIEHMMAELTSRELLSEPFDALAKAYPTWLANNRTSLGVDALRNYEQQCSIVLQIDKLFKEPLSARPADAHKKLVFELMQEMQELGSPPEELLAAANTQSSLEK